MSFDVFEIADLIRTGADAAEFESLITTEDEKTMNDFADWLEQNAGGLTALMK